jgi:hypothetical protein
LSHANVRSTTQRRRPKPLPCFGAAHRKSRQNVAGAQAVPAGCRVIAAVAEHTGRAVTGSAAFALQRRNRIDQGESFL